MPFVAHGGNSARVVERLREGERAVVKFCKRQRARDVKQLFTAAS